MPKYRLLVFSNPIAGREKEFNEWYENVHVPDATKLPGVTSGKRFRVLQDKPWKYLAEYELECEDVAQWEAYAAEAQKKMVLSEAFDFNSYLAMFVEAT